MNTGQFNWVNRNLKHNRESSLVGEGFKEGWNMRWVLEDGKGLNRKKGEEKKYNILGKGNNINRSKTVLMNVGEQDKENSLV